MVDLYIKELNLVIEFNGDCWHANPSLFNENDMPFPLNKKYTAKDIWRNDAERLNFLRTKVRDIIIVWEKDLKDRGIDNIVDELLEKIKSYEYE